VSFGKVRVQQIILAHGIRIAIEFTSRFKYVQGGKFQRTACILIRKHHAFYGLFSLYEDFRFYEEPFMLCLFFIASIDLMLLINNVYCVVF
jgi:hypothetical protein